ncbi:MAG: RNA polymerase sigma-54 factor, partial [Verrucomicrobiae bacterium]|nr:RNA polymerase sigma-54 factor [Verrucomicrobiae bacterium]
MATQGLHQVQRLSLQQILAPQLQQSLHLLQVSTMELQSLIAEELQQNPLLEEVPKDEAPRIEVEPTPANPEENKPDAKEELDFKQEFEVLSKLDEEWREYFAQTSSPRHYTVEQEEQRQHFFDSITEQKSLQQHLVEQLGFVDLSPEERKVAELIIGNINDDGYLLTPLEELAISSGVPLDQLQKVLAVVQTFHPVGVGARDLRECLLLQLKRQGKEDSLEAKVVAEHLEDLGRKRYQEIARALGLTPQQVQE